MTVSPELSDGGTTRHIVDPVDLAQRAVGELTTAADSGIFDTQRVYKLRRDLGRLLNDLNASDDRPHEDSDYTI